MSFQTAASVDEIDFTDVRRVIFNGNWIKKIFNGTQYIWPGAWEDVWRDEF